MSFQGVHDIYKELRSNYSLSEKKKFDKEYFFYSFYRPLSFLPSAICIKFNVSPNIVTLIGALFLLAAFAFLYIGDLLTGSFLYLLAYYLDFIDGNIARYKKVSSFFGKMLDGLVDSLTFLLFISIAVGNIKSGFPVFGENIEMVLGLSTAFVFLFRSYFQIRLAYIQSLLSVEIIKNPSNLEKSKSASINSKSLLSNKRFFKIGKNIYNGIVSGMPIFLILAVLSNQLTFYLVTYMSIFLVGMVLEILLGLKKLYIKEMKC